MHAYTRTPHSHTYMHTKNEPRTHNIAHYRKLNNRSKIDSQLLNIDYGSTLKLSSFTWHVRTWKKITGILSVSTVHVCMCACAILSFIHSFELGMYWRGINVFSLWLPTFNFQHIQKNTSIQHTYKHAYNCRNYNSLST